ncbi:enoyl-CoA hydratase/isomerase family protein [Actinocorallia libanotica]|uniref:Enoyl-CoA hydratase-related protein n=1 Tax=Actinocorallia libanotica TaxID=46162 RepID=A0ABP4CCW7_9ACTN
MITLNRHGHVAEIVLDRPEAHNALSTAMAVRLAAVCAEVADSDARAVVLSSAAPRSFCVGADLKERASMTDDDLMRQRPVFRSAFGAVLHLPQPVVAAVHGFALGGGTEFALSCDLVVADLTAVFGLPEVGVGLIPAGGGTQLLQRRVGTAKAADLIFTGRKVGFDEAVALGLVDRAAPEGEDRATALELAAAIAANSPVALRAAKRALRHGAPLDLAAALDVEDAAWRTTALSGDRREGIAAFNEKRSPDWPGL